MEKVIAKILNKKFEDDKNLKGHFFNEKDFKKFDFKKLQEELLKLNLNLFTLENAPQKFKNDFTMLQTSFLVTK